MWAAGYVDYFRRLWQLWASQWQRASSLRPARCAPQSLKRNFPVLNYTRLQGGQRNRGVPGGCGPEALGPLASTMASLALPWQSLCCCTPQPDPSVH